MSVLDYKELIFALELSDDPYIESGHHCQVPPDALQFFLMVIKILRFETKEIIAVAFIKAVEEDAVEVFVQLRGSVLDEHLHLVDQLRWYFACLTFSCTIGPQVLAADRLMTLRAACYDDLTSVSWVNTVDAETDFESIPLPHLLREAIKVEEQIL